MGPSTAENSHFPPTTPKPYRRQGNNPPSAVDRRPRTHWYPVRPRIQRSRMLAGLRPFYTTEAASIVTTTRPYYSSNTERESHTRWWQAHRQVENDRHTHRHPNRFPLMRTYKLPHYFFPLYPLQTHSSVYSTVTRDHTKRSGHARTTVLLHICSPSRTC